MFKKIALALATIGLATSMPAAAQTRPNVSFELRIGNEGHNQGYNRKHYNRNYPRCNRWEVAVRDPNRYNRYRCINKDDYRRYYREGYYNHPYYRN